MRVRIAIRLRYLIIALENLFVEKKPLSSNSSNGKSLKKSRARIRKPGGCAGYAASSSQRSMIRDEPAGLLFARAPAADEVRPRVEVGDMAPVSNPRRAA